jgi:deazaflavin-dependent oxidoreductase (nitroreductase family)
VKRSAAVELFWKIHPRIYRWSRGRLLGRLAGMDVLLLTTTGAKTGRERTTPLTCFEDAGRFVVIGSVLGEPRHPGWVHNLRARPQASVQLGARHIPVQAYEAQGDERARLWSRAVEIQPEYRDYETQTDRVIPVVVLAPAES